MFVVPFFAVNRSSFAAARSTDLHPPADRSSAGDARQDLRLDGAPTMAALQPEEDLTCSAVRASVCTPCSLAQEAGLALGAQAGEARMRAVVTGAGFTRFRRDADTVQFGLRGASLKRGTNFAATLHRQPRGRSTRNSAAAGLPEVITRRIQKRRFSHGALPT